MSRKTLNLTTDLHDYMLANSLREHSVAKELREYTETLSGANMQISPEQGQFMGLLIKLLGVTRAIEVGTFTGYSALCVALAMPDTGYIVTCDCDDKNPQHAKAFWQKAGVMDKIDLKIAPAIESLNTLLDENQQDSYDFAFIDADKRNYDNYYELLLTLIRPGGLILIDNVLWGGKVLQNHEQDKQTQMIQFVNHKIQQDERVDLSMLPIGDGLTLARKR